MAVSHAQPSTVRVGMTDDIDEYAGLPMAELYPYRAVHPQSVPFGPMPVRYTTYRYYPVE